MLVGKHSAQRLEDNSIPPCHTQNNGVIKCFSNKTLSIFLYSEARKGGSDRLAPGVRTGESPARDRNRQGREGRGPPGGGYLVPAAVVLRGRAVVLQHLGDGALVDALQVQLPLPELEETPGDRETTPMPLPAHASSPRLPVRRTAHFIGRAHLHLRPGSNMETQGSQPHRGEETSLRDVF